MAIFNKISSRNTHNTTNGTSRLRDVVFDTSVSPTFCDFSYGTNDNLRVRSGNNSFSTLIDLPIPIKPNYGAAEIDSYELGLHIHTLRQSGSGEQGAYQVYSNKTVMGANEGDMDSTVEDISFWGSTISDEPCSKAWREDFGGATGADEQVYEDSAGVSTQSNPYLTVEDAMEYRENTATMAAAKNPWLGALGNASIVLQPQVLRPEGMIRIYGDRPLTINQDYSGSDFWSFGRQSLPPNKQKMEETRIYVKEDSTGEYWIPLNKKRFSGDGFWTDPKWKKSTTPLRWGNSSTQSQNPLSAVGPKLDTMGTFFDVIRGVRDIKSSSPQHGGNTDENDYARARIEFTTGLTGQAMKMDQWVGWNNAATETGYINDQPATTFGLDTHKDIMQDQYALKESIPKPVRLTMDDGTTTSPAANTAETNISSKWEMIMDFKFENFEAAYRHTNNISYSYISRGFAIIFSKIKPNPTDSFAKFMYRISGGKTATDLGDNASAGSEVNNVGDNTHVSSVAISGDGTIATFTHATGFFPFIGMELYYSDDGGDTYDFFVEVTSVTDTTHFVANILDLNGYARTDNTTRSGGGDLFCPRAWTGLVFFNYGGAGGTSGIRCTNTASLEIQSDTNGRYWVMHDGAPNSMSTGIFQESTSSATQSVPIGFEEDVYHRLALYTDEDGPNLDSGPSTGGSGINHNDGVFKAVFQDLNGNVKNDQDFYVPNCAYLAQNRETFTEGEGEDLSNNWPEHMSIWQMNMPSRCDYSGSGDDTGNEPQHLLPNHVTGVASGVSVTKSDVALYDSLTGDTAELQYKSAQFKNRRTRMTTLIDKIYFNRTGYKMTNISGKDEIVAPTPWDVTSNVPLRTDTFSSSGEDGYRTVDYKYAPSVLSMGFLNIADLGTVSDSSESGLFLLNGYTTVDVSNVTKFTDAQMRGGYNHATMPAKMGQQARNDFYANASSTAGITVSSDYAAQAYPTLSTDYTATHHLFACGDFSQKGTIRFDEGSSNLMTTGSYAWTKRENIYVSSRVLNIVDSVKGVFSVENTNIFEASENERYMLYVQGRTFTTSDRLDADGDLGNNTWVAPLRLIDISANSITKEKNIISVKAYTSDAEDTEVTTLANILKAENISQLFISPYRYWISLTFISEGEIPNRNYKSMMAVNNFTNPGATFSEYDFYSSYADSLLTQAYYNSRSLVTADGVSSTVEVTKDFGYGPLDAETGQGGHCGQFTPDAIGRNVIPIPALQKVAKYKEDDILPLYITTQTKPDSHEMRMYSSDYTTDTAKRPFLVTKFLDEKPILSSFNVKPDPESDGYYPLFDWSCDDDDIWYGFLNIDKGSVVNQYHNSVLWAPLNDEGEIGRFQINHSVAAAKPSVYTEGGTNQFAPSGITISGPLYDYEGLSGYCLNFDGNDDYVEINNSPTSDATAGCTTEMSIVAHIIPDSASDQRVVVSQYSRDDREKFRILLNSSNQVEARVNFDGGSNYVELTSAAIVADGVTPTSIILTADTTLKTGNVKLFIDGKLADMSGRATTSGGTNNWKVGQAINGGNSELYIGNSASSGTNGFDGRIEEIVVYKTAIYPVDVKAGSYLLTKDFSELIDSHSNASPQTRQVKLFIKDYHNIRGRTTADICTSQALVLKKAGFVLDTTPT